MTDFVRSNKVSGIYWLKSSVKNVKIKVKLKPPYDILSLPKFEDYTSASNSINMEPNIEEHTFKWQEKIFSNWETHHYSDIHNCTTDAEIKYNELLRNNEIAPAKVFTYIHEDFYMPLPYPKKKKEYSKLELCMDYLSLNDTVGSIGRVLGGKSDSMSQLLKSRNSLCEEEKWTAMHVVFDHLDRNDDIPIKQESILLSMYHNTTQNYLIIYPDVNDLETNPYSIDGSIPVYFKYGVTVDLGGMGGSEELETLLTRLHSRWQKKHRVLVDFKTPLLDATHYRVAIELLYAEEFDTDSLYVEYTIKLPEGIQCNDALHGRTHTSECPSDNDVWNFGHLIELWLEADVSEHPPIKLYLETISTDWRLNHRTEGYVYHPLVLAPGFRTLGLTCRRPEERSWRGDDRRFFVGGCNLIQDLEVLSKADGQNASFIYTTTGKIHIRYSIIAQTGSSSIPGVSGTYPSSGSDLLLGAEAALDKYRKARARLVAATRDINIGGGDG